MRPLVVSLGEAPARGAQRQDGMWSSGLELI